MHAWQSNYSQMSIQLLRRGEMSEPDVEVLARSALHAGFAHGCENGVADFFWETVLTQMTSERNRDRPTSKIKNLKADRSPFRGADRHLVKGWV